jgi:hypothetical protein
MARRFGDEVNYGDWANRVGELNGRSDIQAWRVLFEGCVDLLHVPTWPAPAKILVDPGSFADELRALERPIASYLGEILHLWSTEYGAPETRKELWDLACVAAVADPEFVTAGPQALATLDAAGAHDFTQRGRVVNVVSDLEERHGSWRASWKPYKIIHPDRYPEITEQPATSGQGSYQVRTNAVATRVAAIARGAPLTQWIPACAGMTGAEGSRVPASRTPSRANGLGITPKT